MPNSLRAWYSFHTVGMKPLPTYNVQTVRVTALEKKGRGNKSNSCVFQPAGIWTGETEEGKEGGQAGFRVLIFP